MSAPPLVSIIIATYNAARWLPASLDSALAQTYPHREIIVVDDGSTDETPAVLESYRRTHGIRVLTQANQGQSVASNLGLAEARGDYIKFFDADDIMSPDMIALQVDALNRHPGCIAYASWARFSVHTDEAIFTPHPGWHDSQPLEWIIETWAGVETMYQCALFLLPRELLQRAGGWNPRLSLINDLEFFTRVVLQSEGIVFTPEARLYYRSGLPGSVSRQKTHVAMASGLLSVQLSSSYILAGENSPHTRRVCANVLQNLAFDLYPFYPDLTQEALNQIASLGGSSLLPAGGRVFRIITYVFGWKFARRLQRWREYRLAFKVT